LLAFAFWCPGSLVSVITIRAFYKRQRQFKQMMSHSQGASRGLYLRLMAISGIEILGTIPMGTYFIVSNARAGVTPWKGWAYTHSNYSDVVQIAGFIWKNDPNLANGLEIFR
jgi:pheromone a factor receptor